VVKSKPLSKKENHRWGVKKSEHDRLVKLRNILADAAVDAVIVTKNENRRYLSGFSGSAGLLAIGAEKGQYLITDSRYVTQAEEEASGYKIIQISREPYEVLQRLTDEERWRRIGFESDAVCWDQYEAFRTCLAAAAELVPLKLDELRLIKSEAEVAAITRAAAIAAEAFTQIMPYLRPWTSERDIAAELDYRLRRLGSEGNGFETIVASGPRAALPHARPSERRISRGDFVILDFGATYAGYNSDMTRTVIIGRADARQRKVYAAVLAAQEKGLAAVKPGAACRNVDQAARAVIDAAGYGAFFGHGLGHGVGLNVHEAPRLSPYSGEVRLEENMVVTVEPGIYIPGFGGVRIEDLVVVKPGAAQNLTPSPKHLIEIDAD